jgi:hypothetical protein
LLANSLPDATGYSQEQEQGFSEPLRAELPLEPLEAFRLASFGIEYVPRYAPVMVDRHALEAAHWFFRA